MRGSALPTLLTLIPLGMLLIGAPLACGAVHRPAIFVALGVAAALAAATAWLATRSHAGLATATALALPLFFLLTALVQIIPLWPKSRAVVDPKGSALLALAGLQGMQPLSLDPPATWLELAKAAAALSTTLAALALASGHRARLASAALVASTGIAAIVIGLCHRVFDESKIFGMFATSGGLLVGPFVNPNHTAEFLELAAFAALAVAFSRGSRDGQRLWIVAAAVLAAGSISTLSRGSLLALGAGTSSWFLLAPRSDVGLPLRRSRFLTALLVTVVVAGLAIGLGGDRITDEFRGSMSDNLSKLALAMDALRVFAAHPLGIGLGAFSRVYPVYQTLPTSSWFQFVESQPLSILVESGIVGAVALSLILLVVARRCWRRARHDRVEASLIAGMVAVLAHNTVDFGLETLGILLPFCSLLGTLFGRQAMPARNGSVARRGPVRLAVISAVFTLVALVLLASPAARDFDALLQPPPNNASRALAHAASLAHPTDYAYALAAARLEPPGSSQTRMRLLNRAMLLCPRCVGPHQDAARDLWHLGHRRQSILEWKAVIAEAPQSLQAVLEELAAAGAKGEELASLADDWSRVAISRYLLGQGWVEAAKSTLAKASKQDDVEFQLARAEIALAEKDIAGARAAGQRALELAPKASRAAMMAADIAALEGSDSEQMLAILRKGLRFTPNDVALNRRVLAILTQTDRWQAIDEALASFRFALSEAGLSSVEANVAAAQIFERRGQYGRAVSEYQTALGQNPDDIGLRLALGRSAEKSGALATALDAYNDVLRRSPANQEARAALRRIQLDKKEFEVNTVLPTHTGGKTE